jgi:cell division protein FtsI/penicillin-binding protein 2
MDELLANTDSRYAVIAKEVTSQEAAKIKKANLYGVGFTAGIRRVYPEGQLASQVLGFVNADGEGQYGVEGALNDELKGKDGLLKTVVDIREVPLTIGSENVNIPAKDGDNVVLSLDRNIQNAAEQLLPQQLKKVGATDGSLLVMDPNTGKVLAMANYPTYNPNDIKKVKDIALFNNPIISHPYEPASVIKTVDFSTAIDKGAIEPNSTYINTGQIQIEDRTINNASKPAYLMGKIDMQTALNWSFNTGAVTAALRLGNDKDTVDAKARQILYEYYHDRFHLGELTGIELQGETPGIVIPPSDPQGNAVRYANMTFGQGLDITTLQTAAAFSAIINGGVYHPPTIVDGTIDDDGVFVQSESKQTNRAISESTSRKMREMIHVARQQFGYNSQDPAGYYIGGKTGTAQTIENGQYTFSQQTGTYIGFGGTPGEKPAYVVMAYVAKKNTQLGGEDAKVVFDPMSNWMINYLKLPPKG